MKNKFKESFTLITNILILVILLFGGFIWADSNGIWTLAEDIRPGVFGSDEGANSSNSYSFVNDVFFKFVKTSNQTWSKEYCDENGQNCKNISDIGTYNGVECGDGEALTGFDSNGNIICKSLYTYTWNGLGDWGTCTPISGTCGAGLQTQTVECIRNDGVTVANSYCDATTNPESRSCSVPCQITTTVDYPNCHGGSNGACSRTVDLSSYLPIGSSINSVRVSNMGFFAYPDSYNSNTNCGHRYSTLLVSNLDTYDIYHGGTSKWYRAEATLNSVSEELLLKSSAGGWGGCGGSTCGGCLDYVILEIDYNE